MTILLRTGLAVVAAALAVATSRLHAAPPAPARADTLLASEPSGAAPGPACVGLAALSVGGLGLLARLRRR